MISPALHRAAAIAAVTVALSANARIVLRFLLDHGRRLTLTEDGPLAGLDRERFDLAALELVGVGLARIERGLVAAILVLGATQT